MNDYQNRKRIAAVIMATSFLLSSCSGSHSSDYDRARTLFSEGRYDEARELFLGMGDYENSSKYIAYIDAWNAGKNGDYETAFKGFSSLSGFLDSSEEAADFAEQSQKDAYLNALSHFRRGEYDEAVDLLSQLVGYEEADLYLEYASAMLSAREGNFDSAIDSFTSLGDFRDSSFQAERWASKQKAALYEEAQSVLSSGDFARAAELFEGMQDYEDAGRYYQYAKARKDLADGSYEEAIDAFQKLGLFLDSPAMLENASSLHTDSLLKKAENAAKEGQYQDAIDLLGNEQVKGTEEAEYLLRYIDALQTAESGEYDAAAESLDALGEYLDSASKADEIRNEGTKSVYRRAVELFEQGDYASAQEYFFQTQGYEDTDSYLIYLSALSCEENEEYGQASALFKSIEGFRDAAEKSKEDWTVYCERSFVRARQYFEDGAFSEAASIFEEIPEFQNASQYLSYIQAETLGREGEYHQAEAAFLALDDFADSEQRAEIYGLLGKQAVYADAVAFFEKGKYEEAAAAFGEADGYGNAGLYLRYLEGKRQLSDGNAAEAEKTFVGLGSFLDSQELAENAGLSVRADAYAQALASFEQEDFETAEQLFAQSVPYSDAEKYVQYLHARKLEAEGAWKASADNYRQLSDFLDCASREETLRRSIEDQTYLQACDWTMIGRFQDAKAVFESFSGTRDADLYLSYISAREEEESDLQAAELKYAQLGSFLDSEERLAYIQETQQEKAYQDALRQVTLGQLEDARSAFEKLDSYRDSQDYVQYLSARIMENAGNLSDAETLYSQLTVSFLDSARRAETIDAQAVQYIYRHAIDCLEDGSLEQARESFISIYPYEESQLYLDYIQAASYEQEGKYAIAAELFGKLNTFEDAASRLSDCQRALHDEELEKAESLADQGMLSEAQYLLEQYDDEEADLLKQYVQALQLVDEGLYEDAISCLSALNGYKDSAELTAYCREAARRSAYQNAVALFQSGDYENAGTAFSALTGYEDADLYLKCIEADTLRKNGDYAGAIALYQELGDFEDCAERLAAAAQEETQGIYADGMKALNEGRLDEARSCFGITADYSDSTRYLAYIEARILEQQGDYEGAEKAYLALQTGILDSQQRSESCSLKARDLQLQAAEEHMENGEWEEALSILQSLDSDVSDEIAYCRAGLLMQSGDYQGARDAFLAIRHVRSSQSYADACDAAIRNAAYAEGVAAISAGNTDAAKAAFEQAGADYLDTQTYLTYIHARQLEDESQFAEAQSVYASLEDFLDCEARLDSCRKADIKARYLEAAVLLGQGRLKAARDLYEGLDHYLQTDDFLAYIESRRLENAGETLKAADAFSALGSFLDSDLRAARDYETAYAELYSRAQRFYQLGMLERARDTFAMLPEYEDAAQYEAYLTDVITYDQGSHLEKALRFEAYGDFEEAADYAAYLRALQFEDDEQFDEASEIYREHMSFLDSADRFLAMPATIVEHQLKAADELNASGREEEADAVYQEILDYLKSGNGEVASLILRQADASAERGDVENAKTLYTALLLEGGAQTQESLISLAQQSYDRGAFAQALDVLAPIHDSESADSLRDACHLALAAEAEAKNDVQRAYQEYASMRDGSDRTGQLEQAYLDAMNMLIEGDYLKAKDAFAALHNLLDSEERSAESAYRAAGKMEEEGRADEASALFAELGDYRDSASRILEPYHVLGLQLLDSEKWDEAAAAFEKADEIQEGDLLIRKTQYEKAQQYLEAGDYDRASALFAMAGDYLDSSERVQTALLERGDSLYEAGAYAESIEAYQQAYPTEEAWARIQRAHYAWAEELEAAGDRYAASEQFMLADQYLDASNRVREPFDLYGDALAQAGDYSAAVEAYREAGENEKTQKKIEMLMLALQEKHQYEDALAVAGMMDARAGEYEKQIMLHKAEYLMDQHEWDAASEAFAVSSMPERVDEPYEVWAQSLIAAGKYDEAIALYDRLGDTQKSEEGKHLTLMTQADALVQAGKYDDAYEVYMKAGEPDKAVHVYILEGDALLEKHYYDAAAASYAKAGDTDEASEKTKQARYAQALSLLEEERYEEAAEAFGLAADYEDAREKQQEAYQLAAVRYLQAEQYADAVRMYALIGDAQMTKTASYAYGQQLFREERWDEAAAAFVKAGDYEDAAQRVSETYLTAGNQYLSQDRFDDALAMFAKAGEAGTEKIREVHYTRALRLMAEGRSEEASVEFVAAGEYSDAASRIAEPYLTQGSIQIAEGNYEEAVSLLSRAGTDGEDELLRARYLYAESLANQGRWAEAEEQYIAVGSYEDAPARLTAMYATAAETLAEQGKHDEAIAMYLKTGMESGEIIKELHYQEAVNALAHGEWDKAHDAFAAAGDYKDAAERLQEPYLAAGQSLLAQGDYEQAILMFSRAGEAGEEEILRVHYVHAEHAMAQEEWDVASSEFKAAGDYKDAKERVSEAYLIAGDLLLTEGKYEDALSEYARAGDAGADRMALAHYQQAEALMAEQRWDEANREYALAGDLPDAENRINLPYLTAGDHLLAAKAYQEAVAMYAKAGEDGKVKIQNVYYVKAEAMMAEEKWEEAHAAFAAAGDYLDAHKRMTEPYIKAGDLLLQAQKWDEAIETYAKAGDDGAEKIKAAYYGKAEALLKEHEWEKASAAFQEAGDALDAHERIHEPFITAGDLYLNAKAYDDAISMYSKAGEAASEKLASAYYMKAEALMAEHVWDEASLAFYQAGNYKDAADRVNEPFMKAGDELLEAQSFDQAVEMYVRAGEEGREKVQKAYYTKAEILLHALSWEEASQAFRAAGDYLNAQERVSEPFITAGDIFLSAKAWDDALGMYAKAGEDGKESIQKTHYLHAEALLQAHEWAQSSAEFAAAGSYADAASRIAEPYLTAGSIALQAGQYAEAVSHYAAAGSAGEEALKAAYYSYAEDLMNQNAWDEASRAFTLSGDYSDAKERISEPYVRAAEAEEAAGNYDLASGFYKKAGRETDAQRAMYRHAEALIAKEDWDGASSAFLACGDYLDASARVSEPYILCGDQYLARHEYDEAILMYQKAGEAGLTSIQKAHYMQAEDLLAQNKWDEANQMFLLAGDYMDAAERANTAFQAEGDYLLAQGKKAEAFIAYAKAGDAGKKWIHAVHYADAEAALEQGAWDVASNEFQLAEDYLDSQVRVYEPYYVQGKQLLAQEQYLSAGHAFEKAEDYQDARERAKEAWYEYGQDLLDAQEYVQANSSFTKASGYLNADEMANESMYLLGSAYLEQTDYEKAYDALRTIRGYRDTDDLLNSWRLRKVAEGRTGKRSKFMVGRNIGLGSFMQSAGCDQKETVEWQIIYRDDHRVLLTTRYIMTASAFSTDGSDYMGSKVRSFLNGTFFNECFDGQLRASLIPQEELDGDRVFLLSKEEADTYLLNGKWNYKNRSAAKSWARSQGVSVSGEHHVGRYWLRDSVDTDTKAMAVLQDGSYDLLDVQDAAVGVRPAIWIDLDILYPQ